MTTDSSRLSESMSIQRDAWLDEDGILHRQSTEQPPHDLIRYRFNLKIEKRWGPWTYDEIVAGEADKPYEIFEHEGNLMMTAGATALWNGLSTAGLATPFNTTNAQIAVGDSVTAASAGQTDLQAALATKLNAADVASATNATPIVVTGTYSPTPIVGQVVALSGFSGAGAAAINQTFELSAASAGSITLLNSAGTGSITVIGGIVQPVNKYRQQANGSGSAVVTTNSIVYVAVFGVNNACFHWQEFGITTGAAATNKQAAPPPTLFNRAVTDMGTKPVGSATWTPTATLSLA